VPAEIVHFPDERPHQALFNYSNAPAQSVQVQAIPARSCREPMYLSIRHRT
jgi:hypothetical protein